MNTEESEVYWAVEDYISNHQELCTVKEIMSETSFKRKKCEKVLQELVNKDLITLAYKSRGKGSASIYVPKYMMIELLRKQKKPRWTDNYTLEEKKALLTRIQDMQTKIDEFEKLEMLLYASGIPLEEAVCYSMKFLGFRDPMHDAKNKNDADISLFHEGKLYMIEIKGKKGQGNKDDVLQLEGWVTKKIEENQMKNDDIIGILAVNHNRQEDPEEREEPLTAIAKEFMKRYSFRLISTPFLYDLVGKVVRGSLPKDEARNIFLEGEDYE